MKGGLRVAASPSELRNAVINIAGETLYTTGLASTKTCRQCGKKQDVAGSRVYVCECGYTADRDANACGNVLDAFAKKPETFTTERRVAKKLDAMKEAKAVGAAAA